jgi:hypothetical protein
VGVATAGATATNTANPDDRDGSAPLFGALLTGNAEVPGPGDGDGAAAVLARINPDTGRVCVVAFAINQIGKPILFHIHQGAPDVAGPVVVDFVPLLPDGTGCVRADPKVTRAIVQDPSGFYYNIHTAKFPAGAVRGTLVKI